MSHVENALKKIPISYSVIDKTAWKPGIIRCIIKKGAAKASKKIKRFGLRAPQKLWRSRMNIYQHRKSFLEQFVKVDNLCGLEIGPLDKPVIRKEDGSIKYIDYMAKDELSKRHPNAVNPKELVDIDYVISPQQKISSALSEKVDYLIACHVIEHIPNMIAWLEDIHAILNNHGYLFLAVPDKRYTFDILRTLTPLSHLLNDYHRNIEKADFEHVFEHIYLKREISSSMFWNNSLGNALSKARFTVSDAYARSLREIGPDKYPDIHCHVFTGPYFMEVIESLIEMRLLRYSICAFEDVRRPFNEFLVVLQKSD